MVALLEGDLDRYSRVAVPIILSRFPEWETHSRLVPRADGAGKIVEFRIPCPSAAAESEIVVSTANEELSVAFHTHHSHFTKHGDRLNRVAIDAGLDFIAAIIEDRIGVLSYYKGRQFLGSRSVDLPHPDALPDLYEAMGPAEVLARLLGNWDRVTLRTWSGRFDREEGRG